LLKTGDCMPEPIEFTAGDTVIFNRTLKDYSPADGWALSYTLVGQGGVLKDKQGVSNGTGFDFEFTADETAVLRRGEYRLIGRVSRASVKFTVYNGDVSVCQNLFDADKAVDTRHRLEIRLEAINAVLDGRANTDQQYLAIGGRTLQRMPISELIELRNDARIALKQIRNREGVAAGKANKNKIKIRFV